MSVQSLRAGSEVDGRPAMPPAPVVGQARSITAFAAAAGALVVAGGVVAAVNSAAPFDRGSWLAAYLVLVGGVSQIVLGAGGILLRATPPAGRPFAAQLALWNLGSLLVPAGVLADAPALVSVGSAALLGALVLFAVGTRGAGARAPGAVLAYRAAIVALATSVVVGSALADAPPGSWI